ncbi:MAG: RNA polymerase sigma factor [Planctomycetia bacterium]|nr:RNA polymerase sigma factor [Planctomycetia bacterium]
MRQSSWRSLREYIRRLSGVRAAEETSDSELLRRWVDLRDEAAFELLVWRHGGMVLDLCGRVLTDSQEAEDAFQATFLVLVKKAASVRNRAALGSWLYKVAFRVALAAREQAARRDADCLTPDAVAAPAESQAHADQDLHAAVAAEVERLPERYRAPIVLCVLEGRTVDEASQAIGCARWTLATRLARGKERLRRSLARRGVALSVASLTATLTGNASAALVPPALVQTTVQAALAHVGLTGGTVTLAVAALANQVGRAMLWRQAATVCFTLVTASLVLGGMGLALHRAEPRLPPNPATVNASRAAALPDQAEEPDLPPLILEALPSLAALPPVVLPERQFADEALTVLEVSPDGNQVRLQFPPTQDDPVGKVMPLHWSEQSNLQFSWVGRGAALVVPGMKATRIYVNGADGQHLTRIHFNGEHGRRKASRPSGPPDYNTTILEVGAEAQQVILSLPRAASDLARVPVSLTPTTLEVYFQVPAGGAVPRPGYRVMIWLVEGSTDQAAVAWFIPRTR